MAIVINGSGTVTGVTNVGSAAANTAVVMNDSGSNSNTCRAWVNFNGTGTVAIRASFNVSSITDNGTGRYVVNFTNALPDINYSISASASMNYGSALIFSPSLNTNGADSSERAPTTTSCEIYTAQSNTAAVDPKYVNISIFR